VNAGLILFDAEAMAVGEQLVLARARYERIEHTRLQVAAVDRELRMIVARRAASAP